MTAPDPAAARRDAEEALRPVSDDEAQEILSRFIASHFRKHDREHARFRIPADPEHDDDLRMSQYIRETRALRALLAAEPSAPMSDEDECPCCLTHSCEAFRGYIASTLRPAPPAAPAPDAVESIIVLTPAHGVAPITITRSAGGLHTDALPAPDAPSALPPEVREAAETELAAIDALLDRRHALDGLTSRYDKILLALRVAERADPKGEIAAGLRRALAARDGGGE